MRQQFDARPRSLAPARMATDRPDTSRPTRAAVVQAVSSQLRAQARAAATGSVISSGHKR